jgi:UPF0716 protein FxsA
MWLLIFFLTPVVEMYLLIEVGGYIGSLPTIGLVMITAVIGIALLKRQGLATLTRGVSRLQKGELPAREMVEGLLLAVAGALLLTPGFVTDAIGFVLLTPVLRAMVAERVLARVQVMEATATVYQSQGGVQFRREYRSGGVEPGAPTTLEGDFESIEDPEADPKPPGL